MSAINISRPASPAPTSSTTERPALSRSPSTKYHETSNSLSNVDTLQQPATPKAEQPAASTPKADESAQPEATPSAKTNKFVGFFRAGYNKTKAAGSKVASAVATGVLTVGSKIKQGAVASYNAVKKAIVKTGNAIKSGFTMIANGFKAAGNKLASTSRSKTDGAETLESIVTEGKGKARAQADDVQA